MYNHLGIDRGALLPVCSIENAFALQSNEQAAIVAGENPDLFVWFMNFDPRMAYNNQRCNLTYFMEHHMTMVQEDTASWSPTSDDEQYGHYGIQDGLGMPRLEAILKKHPKLKILGHSMMFWSHISGDVTRTNMNGYPDR